VSADYRCQQLGAILLYCRDEPRDRLFVIRVYRQSGYDVLGRL
jgi:hypothetical protein